MTAFPHANNRQRYEAVLRMLVRILGFAALVSLCLEYGFVRPPVPVGLLIGVQLAAVTAYLVHVALAAASAGSVLRAARRQWPDVVLILVAGLLLLGHVELTEQPVLKLGTIYVATIQVLLVLRFVAGAVRWNLEMSQARLHPARLLVLSFLVVIVAGGLLLCLPKAVSPELRAESGHYRSARIVKSFFTATSATCVTGLVVLDTGSDYTRFGQIVILVLIQVGGLGIMILATLFGLLIGRNLSLRQSLVLQDALSSQTIGRMRSIVRFVVVATFACELAGAMLCYPMVARYVEPMGERVFHCVFHAVSAFCNAGFALQRDNLIRYGSSGWLYVSIMPLIVVGGLGFPVLHDLWIWLSLKLRPSPPKHADGYIVFARPVAQRRIHRLKLHTKLVLITTAALIVVPAVFFFVIESIEWRSRFQRKNASYLSQMIELPPAERAGAALFQSVTARTAGFSTVAMDVDSLSLASHLLLVLLMFVGGSPASTAGGVKTATAAVLVLGLINTLRRSENVEAFGRTVPTEVIKRASAIVVLMAGVVFLICLALSITESAGLREIVFEAVSACGTVGLSTGLTERLTMTGQLIIMIGMVAGRLGPLTVMIAVAGDEPRRSYEYPTEHVTIG